jgi:hypothetical protein
MKKIIFVYSLLVCCYSNYAQPCNDALLDTLHGKWMTLIPGPLPNNLSKATLQKERLAMQGVIEILRKNIPDMPIAGNIGYGSFWETDDHRPLPIIKISNSYYTYIYYMQLRCVNGKVGGDKDFGDGSSFHIFFNELPFTFGNSFYAARRKGTNQDEDPMTDVYATVRQLPVVKDGYFDFIWDDVDGSGNVTGNVRQSRTIIKNGRLPYAVVSKKEFYEKWKHKHEVEIESEKAEKDTYKKELAGNDQLEGFLKYCDQMMGIYQNYIDKINTILKTKSPEALAQPAYEGEELGDYFESRQADGYMRAYILKPNFDYYNYHLNDIAAPQLITLRFDYYQDADALGKRRYNCPKFHKALEKMKVFDLLAEKLHPLIVQ